MSSLFQYVDRPSPATSPVPSLVSRVDSPEPGLGAPRSFTATAANPDIRDAMPPEPVVNRDPPAYSEPQEFDVGLIDRSISQPPQVTEGVLINLRCIAPVQLERVRQQKPPLE